jgi:hypothetical protein
MEIHRIEVLAVAVTMILAMSGCNDQAARIAEESAKRQAEQNQSLARLHQQVAAGTKRLAAEEAEARKQALVVHERLQHERSQLNEGWNDLESERQAIAGSRRTESFLAALLKGSGVVLIVVLTLAFAWLALYSANREPESAMICQLVIDELTSSESIEALPIRQLKSSGQDLNRAALPSTTSTKESS